MTGPNSNPILNPETRAKLERLGITVEPRATYEWGGYRYSNASDAIAAAERAAQ